MRWILRLYPRRWRDRYHDEVAEVLDATAPTFNVAADLLLGALDAHLRPQSAWDPEGAREGAPWTLAIVGVGVLLFVWWLTEPTPTPWVPAPPEAASHEAP